MTGFKLDESSWQLCLPEYGQKMKKRILTLFSATSNYPQSLQTVYLVLNKGYRVWMQNYSSHASKIHDRKMYNVFSGALIKDI